MHLCLIRSVVNLIITVNAVIALMLSTSKKVKYDKLREIYKQDAEGKRHDRNVWLPVSKPVNNRCTEISCYPPHNLSSGFNPKKRRT